MTSPAHSSWRPVASKPRSKYRVRTDEAGKLARTVDGILFDSKAEAKRYSELKLLERAGEITGLKLQVTFPLRIGSTLIAEYRSDFLYSPKDSLRPIVEDVKGHRTRDYIIKKKLMKALYGIDIVEVRA